jgi:hypothetical protein
MEENSNTTRSFQGHKYYTSQNKQDLHSILAQLLHSSATGAEMAAYLHPKERYAGQ